MSKAHQVPGAMCPTCGSENDGASLVDGDEDKPPEIGDYSVCVYCGQILTYLALDRLGPVSAAELAGVHLETREVLRKLSRTIKDYHLRKN